MKMIVIRSKSTGIGRLYQSPFFRVPILSIGVILVYIILPIKSTSIGIPVPILSQLVWANRRIYIRHAYSSPIPVLNNSP